LGADTVYHERNTYGKNVLYVKFVLHFCLQIFFGAFFSYRVTTRLKVRGKAANQHPFMHSDQQISETIPCLKTVAVPSRSEIYLTTDDQSQVADLQNTNFQNTSEERLT
jgi:hypothetical protein